MRGSLPSWRHLSGLALHCRLTTAYCLLSFAHSCLAAPPAVSNVRAVQRVGTKLVDVFYDLADADSPAVRVSLEVTNNGVAVPAVSLSGNGVGEGVAPGALRSILWNAGADWDGQVSDRMRFRVVVNDDPIPAGMALIPAGNFQMGNALSATGDGNADELPLHTVYVSAFYMDRYEVTNQLWDDVRAWGLTHGYTDIPVGSGKAATHPVQSITWYSMVKWCNARSEKEGLLAMYFTNDAQTTIYKTGSVNVTNVQVKWSANGYRLPTEAEWEKAARGGTNGHRFPWSNVETITHSQANYQSSTSYSYDVSPTLGYHPTYAVGGTPYTSPVGSFGSNGYGLYDMAGNVWEWCWDWYGSSYYSTSPSTDPQGSPPGSYRVFRGGRWGSFAFRTSVAHRSSGSPGDANDGVGFRAVRR